MTTPDRIPNAATINVAQFIELFSFSSLLVAPWEIGIFFRDIGTTLGFHVDTLCSW
jgi:hypothetical protein